MFWVSPRHCCPAGTWMPPTQTAVCCPQCETGTESWSLSADCQTDTWTQHGGLSDKRPEHNTENQMDRKNTWRQERGHQIWHTTSIINWPAVSQEAVSGNGVNVWDHGGHAAVHRHSKGDVMKLSDWNFKLHHISQQELSRRTRELPIIWRTRGKNKHNSGLSRQKSCNP